MGWGACRQKAWEQQAGRVGRVAMGGRQVVVAAVVEEEEEVGVCAAMCAG